MSTLYKIYQTFTTITQPLLNGVGPFLAENPEATLDDFWESVASFGHGPIAPWAPGATDSWVTQSLGTALQRQVRIFFYVCGMFAEVYHSISPFPVFGLSLHAQRCLGSSICFFLMHRLTHPANLPCESNDIYSGFFTGELLSQ